MALNTPDPHQVLSDADMIVHSVVYEGLVRMRFPEVMPSLATSWFSDDQNRLWRFTLRDAEFHNGRRVTAQDVVFSLNRVLGDARFAMHTILSERIAKVAALDDATIEIELHRGGSSFLSDLALGCRCAIIPPESVDGDGNIVSPIGSGPYRLNEFTTRQAVLTKFSPHPRLRDEALADEAIISVEPDAAARLQALEDGRVDWVYALPLESLHELEGSGVEVGSFDNGTVSRLVFNHTREPFSDVEMRRVVAASIDRHAISEAVYSGVAVAQTQPFPATSNLRLVESVDVMSVDAAAGVLKTVSDERRRITAIRQAGSDEKLWEEISRQLSIVGFEVTVDVIDDENIAYKRAFGLDYDLVIYNQSHPYDWYRVFGYYDPENAGNVWVGGYSNEKIVQSLRDMPDTTIQAEREHFQGVFDQLAEDAATVYLVSLPITHAWRTGDDIAAGTGLAFVRDADP